MACGAKIDKPFIYESHFPLSFEKYIVFQPQTPYSSRNFDYWQDVIDLLYPILNQQNIKIIQVGLPNEDVYRNVVDLRGQTNYHQLAYIVKNSMLCLSADSFCVHLSNHYDKPIVSLYSISMKNVAGPQLNGGYDSNKHILFEGYERVGNKKPSYSPQEMPKSINTIKPEEITDAVFKLLNINSRVPFKTIHTGAKYLNKIVRELVPIGPHGSAFPEHPIEIRADYGCDINMLDAQLSYWQKAILVTEKEIDVNLIKKHKPRINTFVYKLTGQDNPDYVKKIISLGIPTMLLSELDDEEIQKKKIQYYEYGLINKVEKPSAEKIASILNTGGQLFYRSNKVTIAADKIYSSRQEFVNGTPSRQEFEYRPLPSGQLFWNDLDFVTIIQKN